MTVISDGISSGIKKKKTTSRPFSRPSPSRPPSGSKQHCSWRSVLTWKAQWRVNRPTPEAALSSSAGSTGMLCWVLLAPTRGRVRVTKPVPRDHVRAAKRVRHPVARLRRFGLRCICTSAMTAMSRRGTATISRTTRMPFTSS